MQLKIPTKHMDIIPVSIMAFLCAIVVMLIRSISVNRTADEWLVEKQATAISCTDTWPTEAGSSGEKNNGGCAHQPGASRLLAIGGEKRNKIHTC